MGVFNRRKKKSVAPNSPSEAVPDSPALPLSLISSASEPPRLIGPVSYSSNNFTRVFSPLSFRSKNAFQSAGSPAHLSPSPTSIQQSANSRAASTPTSTDAGVVQHHSPSQKNSLSPTMAAIEARTFQRGSGSSPRSDSSPTAKQDSAGRRKTFRPFLRNSEAPSSDAPSQELLDNWLIGFNDLVVGRTIGHSSFGTVCEGKLNGTKVAIKTIMRDTSATSTTTLEDFKREADFNCRLRHPNIVLFMGIAIQPTKICMISELMARGNVRDLLVGTVKGRLIRLDWCLRQQWALDTAQGMAHLHSLDPPMIHRDLKTTNLLVDRGMTVKICDFGLSRFRSEKLMTAVGTVHFAAPEILRNEVYNEKVDLFSYGTVLWELYTREVVFQNMPQIEVYTSVVNGKMPSVDDQCDNRYKDLMNECWSVDAASRPSFEEVIERLSVLVDEMENKQ